MAPFGISRKKQKETVTAQQTQKTLLEELCGDDKELYEVLSRTILLNPERIEKEGINSYLEKAQEFEKAGDYVKARIAYQAAAEISLYDGKLAQAQKFFKKAVELDPKGPYRKVFEYFNEKENAERALAVALQFYGKTGRPAEKKEGSSD